MKKSADVCDPTGKDWAYLHEAQDYGVLPIFYLDLSSGLRSTFTTLMIQNGADPKTLSAMLGHYSAAFTLDVYSNVTNTMQKSAAEKMGAFMEKVI